MRTALSFLMALLITAPALAATRLHRSYPDPMEVGTDGKTSFKLIVTPTTVASAPTDVMVVLRIENPGEKYYCLELEVRWDGGSRKRGDENCLPYNEVEHESSTSYSTKIDDRLIGPHVLTVNLIRSKGEGKEEVVFSRKATINGHLMPSESGYSAANTADSIRP